jgi:chemotaxis protein histidine kinase CheA
MTGGLIDFFILEASEYVDELDTLVSRATARPPEPTAFGRTLRALRGSATMAKVAGIADVAQGLERLARRVRDGDLPWDAETRGIAVAAVDDTKILLRAVRSWGPADDARVSERVAELERIAPERPSAAPIRTAAEYLATAAAQAAAGLLEYAENPAGSEQLARVMDKVRSLRGVAALNDLPPLAEVVDAVDAAAKPIELGHESATAERRRLFRTAARVLLEGGDAVRNGGAPPTDSVALREFSHASSTLTDSVSHEDDVVPIASLLSGEADSVQASVHPPTTAAERFRLEVVSQAEHLRRLVHDGRTATDTASRDRLGRELRGAVRGIARAAQSFGATDIAKVFLAAEGGASTLDAAALDTLERGAALLSRADAAPETLASDFAALGVAHVRTPRGTTPAEATPPAAPTAAAPAVPVAPTPAAGAPAVSAPARPLSPTPPGEPPSGAALRNLLAVGLSGLGAIERDRFAEPVVGEEDDVVPIDELLFRGKDALARAIAIGDALRQHDAAPDPDTLAELYDLLQLAAAE